MGSKLLLFAKRLYRTDQPAHRLRNFVVSLVFLIPFSLLVFFYGVGLQKEWGIWSASTPEIGVQPSDWRISLEGTPCDWNSIESCPAKPSEKGIWSAEYYQSEAEVVRLVKKGKVGPFWLAQKVDTPTSRLAREKKAYHFLLGWIKGEFQVWVNGDLVKTVDSQNRTPQSFEVPFSALGKPIYIAIYVVPREGAVNVLPFNFEMGMGFASDSVQWGYERFYEFVEKTKASSLFFIYGILSLVFFFIWTINRKYSEYFYLACYSLLIATPELFYSDFFVFRMAEAWAFPFYYFWLFAKAGMGLSLGLAFARANRNLVEGSLLTFLVLGGLIGAFGPSELLVDSRKVVAQIVVPSAFLVGGLACLLQVLVLNSRASKKSLLKTRVFQLRGFGYTLLGLSALSYVQFLPELGYVSQQLLWGVPELICFIYLGALALSMLRHSSQLNEKIPISSFHKRAHLPDWVAGSVLMMDLKKSEKIFEKQLADGHGHYVSTILSHFWSVITESGGEVFRAEGDEIVAFFHGSDETQCLRSALDAVDRTEQVCQQLKAQFDFKEDMCFRASVVHGKIKPIWNESSGKRIPAWEQAGERMVFVEAARILDLEKKLECPSSQTVFLSEQLPQSGGLQPLTGEFKTWSSGFTGKHGVEYRLTSYRPKTSSQKLKLAS